MLKDKFFLGTIVFTILIISVGIFFAFRMEESGSMDPNEKVGMKVENTYHDWGEIGINEGDVSASFEIKNEGEEALKIADIKTSCMCTTAKLKINGKESPVFGMHTKSSYVASISPGDTGTLEVDFDPDYHGPSGIGPITRQVTMITNDPNNQDMTFLLEAVVKK